MQNSLLFLVKTVCNLYLLTYLLRFILQWVRADYYNPFAQFVLKVTNPLVVPARRLLPSVGGIDFPTLVVLVVLEALTTWLLVALANVTTPIPIAWFALYVVLRLVSLALWFYLVAILIYVILSWVGQRQHSPVGAVLGDLVEPMLRPARRLLPPIAGLDLAPLLVVILIQATIIALPLPWFLR
jgi:YggT family protein